MPAISSTISRTSYYYLHDGKFIYSFSSVPMKTMEDSESSTPDIDPENDVNYFQSIKDPDDYDSIFQPRRQERKYC